MSASRRVRTGVLAALMASVGSCTASDTAQTPGRDAPAERAHSEPAAVEKAQPPPVAAPVVAAEPPAQPIPQGHVDTTDALVLGNMYWAPSQYLLGGDFALVAGGVVRAMSKMQANSAALRGGRTIFEARIEVEQVLRYRPPPRHRADPAPTFIVTELADGLRVGDRVIVFAHEYDGGYGMIEARGSNCRFGIKVDGWSDPIVDALRAVLAGTADLSDTAQAEAWRPFGAAAVQCFLDQVPVGMCE